MNTYDYDTLKSFLYSIGQMTDRVSVARFQISGGLESLEGKLVSITRYVVTVYSKYCDTLYRWESETPDYAPETLEARVVLKLLELHGFTILDGEWTVEEIDYLKEQL